MSNTLLAVVDRAYARRSWHGSNLRGSIRGVSVAEAAWRPAPGRHNIWEIVVHAAYWKYAVTRRLTGAPRSTFPLQGSDWFERNPGGSERVWREDIALLERMHGELRDAIAACLDSRLEARSGSVTFLDLISGIAAHDVYHAGQIQLLKRLYRSQAGGRGRTGRALIG